MIILGHDQSESNPPSLIEAVRTWRGQLPAGESLALVPTMGALHEGHLSLVRAAREECDQVALTIFVNPTQFAPGEDLSEYPRTLKKDLEKARKAGVDLVWLGQAELLYPPGFSTEVIVPELSERLCGLSRPHHFGGVCIVVLKLFNIFQPTHAYFGEKDLQQVTIIERMTRDLNLPLEIVSCPLVREPDGLAMSSRNVRLSDEERVTALSLSAVLGQIVSSHAAGEMNVEKLLKDARSLLPAEVSLEYLEILDRSSLQPLQDLSESPDAVTCLAARVGEVRLIDNMALVHPR